MCVCMCCLSGVWVCNDAPLHDHYSIIFLVVQERPSSSDEEEEGGRGKRPDNSNIQLAVQACTLMGKAWPSVTSTRGAVCPYTLAQAALMLV